MKIAEILSYYLVRNREMSKEVKEIRVIRERRDVGRKIERKECKRFTEEKKKKTKKKGTEMRCMYHSVSR